MKKSVHISVVSPIYNDSLTLRSVLTSLDRLLSKRKESYEIICIDDKSTDDSLKTAYACKKRMRNLQIYTHNINQGIAKTYRELYARSTGNIVVLFSMDGEWNPHDVIRLLDTQKKTTADIVIGCRVHKQYTLWRGVVSSVYNLLMEHLFHVQTKDAGSIKVFKKKVLSLPIISTGVFDEAERLIRAKRQGMRIDYLAIDHYKKVKKNRGIRFSHVLEAISDMLHVYRALRT